ncbi:aminoglycoside phosphotransferase family protein [Aspergillus homomorphus CBS 101889]|uniref:Altered inheritance of mitochondria protein 9, mitochondrial n=1 Tax=Aspergillus homomorphus (strain CBS 101889) TaxID=1450537 RepID=A0A395HP13_ASPHC|nr:phosphotransferase enzyme family protein [Aspergillus homomorphus CBS 101889]RAL09173.1 phosphotransferase enzyme family protein [Aspergillus homomorphus CBS 101889]
MTCCSEVLKLCGLCTTARPPRSKHHRFYTHRAFGIDPCSYTSGRWLRRVHSERASRYIAFDFNALCRRIEGGFNRVFIFTLSDSTKVVARLPFPLAGPARLTTNSEVATIRYLQANTRIPIPTILDWSDDARAADNAIGSEYILMEHAPGDSLQTKWQDMAGDQRVRCIGAIVHHIKDATDLKFPGYGSLYLNNSWVGAERMQPLDATFCLGPHCGTRYSDYKLGDPPSYYGRGQNRGPWSTLDDFCKGLIDAGVARLPHSATDENRKPFYHDIQRSASPLLFHPDLHKRNIFVSEDDPTLITGIIDWQATSIEPAFWYSDEMPDFVLSAGSSNGLYRKAFESFSQLLAPALSGPRLMDESLFRPFRYSYRTWKDGAVALRRELIETAQNWEKLGFAGQCPFPLPTPEELAKHEKEYRLFVAAQDLKRDLSGLLDSDSGGWVPVEEWEATQLRHRELFDGMLEAVLLNEEVDDDEPVTDEETLRSIWPFDLP